MNYLTQSFKETVTVSGEELKIDSSLKAALSFEKLLKDEELDSLDIVLKAVDIFFPSCSEKEKLLNLSEKMEAIMDFYLMRDESDSDYVKEEKKKTRREKPVTDLELDSRYIYSAFMEQYGIDLQKEDMHWHGFLILLEGLSEKVLYKKIIFWRSVNLRDVSEHEREFYREMKELYKLPELTKAELDELEEINKILESGGDLSF